MNEEEIIDRIKRIIDLSYTKNFATFELMYQNVDAIKGLLDLYKQEKEKNNKEYDRGYKEGLAKALEILTGSKYE